jgi:chorismate-pyruvate lyase
VPSAALLTTPPGVLALHEKLLASPSATAVLRDVFGDPVEIRRLPEAAPPTDAQCARLGVASAADITHRRVVLVAAGLPASRADLWYVPARLWPGMAETLLTTTIPFGTVVAPMQPARDTTLARICRADEAYALEHEAVLRVGAVPIALVREQYFRTAE